MSLGLHLHVVCRIHITPVTPAMVSIFSCTVSFHCVTACVTHTDIFAY